MAKSRMAGEALSNAERNRQTREEIGNDPDRLSKRIAGVDREKYDFDGYTDKEINMALQGSTFGEEDYARLTGKSIGDGDDDKPEEVKPPSPSPAPTPTPDPEPSPIAPKPEKPDITIPVIPVGPGGGQYVNQNNDINTTITGDNNTVDSNQDNSVSQGGDYASRYARGLKSQYVLNLLGK